MLDGLVILIYSYQYTFWPMLTTFYWFHMEYTQQKKFRNLSVQLSWQLTA